MTSHQRFRVGSAALLTLAIIAAFAVATRPTSASTPATSDWHGWHFTTSSPRVHNFSSWSIDDAIENWNEDSQLSPYEIISGSIDITVADAYEESGVVGWVYGVFDGTITCGTRYTADWNNCNHTTKLADYGSIRVNAYHDDLTISEEAFVIMHEMGHVFGLAHHAASNLMQTGGLSGANMSHVDYHLGAWY